MVRITRDTLDTPFSCSTPGDITLKGQNVTPGV